MKGKRLLIAFIPPKNIIKNIIKIRKDKNIIPPASSGLKTHHITIIDNTFSSIKEVNAKLEKVSQSNSPINTCFEGLSSFVVNKKAGIEKFKQNNSLIYKIKRNAKLDNFRKRLLDDLEKLKTSDRYFKLIKENPQISKRNAENIKKFGTPFSLKEWRFHITIGLIPKEKQRYFLKNFENLKINKSFRIDRFALFIREEGGWSLLKKYALKDTP